ncbi:MAG TPA: MerR family transcriptional regulator [Gammaproteobacteria bacterium]|nr:MerR family transcriptional regulator [Gammaproteobacteria bacterium]
MNSNADEGRLAVEWLGDDCRLTLAQLCRLTRLSAEELIEMVEAGVLDPLGGQPTEWRFGAPAVRRVQVAMRLRRDLQVNLAGSAMVLDLLDELRALRERLRVLENRD